MVLIREIEEKDIPAVLRLIKDSYAPYKELIDGAGIPEYSYEEVCSLAAEPHSDVWVAEENGEITGMAAGTEFGPCAYHLRMLFVGGGSQHKGVGSELLAHFEARGTERRHSLYTANYLDWAKWSGQFYAKHGYREFVPGDEKNNPGLKAQTDFLKKIGKLNNGDKHFIWKSTGA